MQFHNYEEVIESEKSIESRREVEPSYAGYKNYMAYFEIELYIRAEKIVDGQIVETSFKGEVNFIEIIRHWVQNGERWVKVGDLPLVETMLDISEVRHEQKDQSTT